MTHSSQTPPSQSGRSEARPAWLPYLLLAVMGLALGLRIWGIDFGLGYDFTTDESKEVHRAFKLGAGEYSWKFGKGGLYYLLFVEYALLYVVWWLSGVVSTTHEFALRVVQDQTTVFFLARLTVALQGALTCLIIFWTGARIYDWRVGLGAAFIGATAYAHGMNSHYIMVDIGMVLALWASLLAYLEYEHRQNRRWLLGAGALGGIAIAFKLPGVIALPLLLAALASRPGRWRAPRLLLKEAGLVVLAMLITLTVVAPEWTTSLSSFHQNFSRVLGIEAPSQMAAQDGMREAIHAVTIYRAHTSWLVGFKLLLEKHNFVLTLSALLGAALGLWRRHRWDTIWSGVSLAFLGIISAADRSIPEYYLLPIMPALWLLSSRAIMTVLGRRWWLAGTGFACVVALSFAALVYQNYMWTRPDTRVLAKDWIEAHIPSGAKILMDGMRYRFVMSPPLQPNRSVIMRQVAQASHEGEQLSRGVSSKALALYAEAMTQVKGPTYDLHSTVWGLNVKDLTAYVQSCFDYIITSSEITKRYVRVEDRKRFPRSAQFYDQVKTDTRFRVVYTGTPIPWQITGPTIQVYQALPACPDR